MAFAPPAKVKPGRPLRIFLYGMNFAPEMTGVGRYSGELAAYLAQQGAQVEVVTAPPHYPQWAIAAPHDGKRYAFERQENLRINRCPISIRPGMGRGWRIWASLSFALSSVPVALWRMLRMRPDVVLVVEPTLFVAPMGLLAARLAGARVMLHVQDLEVDAAFAVGHVTGRSLKGILNFAERVLLAGFDRVITISNQMALRLSEKGVRDSKIAIVRNWVDLGLIYPDTASNVFRRELGISDDTYVVLYAGSVGAKQALHTVLDAAVQLDGAPDIQFVIAGEGPEKARLMERYKSLQNVRFLPLQPEDRLCALLNFANLHVLPQNPDAGDLVLPSKLGGILASGRDLLVAANPGTELHTFLDGAAHITAPGDVTAMADTIRKLADAPRQAPLVNRELLAQLDSQSNLAEFFALLDVRKNNQAG